jgi:hypothetical protein
MMRGLAWLGWALGLAVALGGCAADGGAGRAGLPGRIPAPANLPDPPSLGQPKDPVPVVAEMPEGASAATLAPELTWEPGTLPPGWYIPDPPAAPEDPVVPPDPAQRMANLLRQNAWLTRFWSELSPAEQLRVTRALARRGAQPLAAPAAWDPMGLQDRVELLFGRRGGA